MKTEISTKQVFSYICNILRSYKISLCVMLWAVFFWAFDLSVRPYLLKIILNRVAYENSVSNIFSLVATPVLLYLLMAFILTSTFRLYDYFISIKLIPDLRAKLANDALGRLIDKSHIYYQNNFSGSLANKINDLTSAVPELIQIVIDRFFCYVLALSFAVFTLWTVDLKFAIFMLGWAGIFLVGAIFFSKRLTNLADDYSEHGSIITGQIVDVLSNILSVRLFSAKKQEKQTLDRTFTKAVHAEQKLQWSYLLMWFCFGYSFFILQCLNFYFLLKGRQEGWVTVGDFALVLMLNMSIIDFLWQLAREFSNFSRILGKIKQALRAVFDLTEIKDNSEATKLVVSAGKIVFEQVKFNYKNADLLFNNKSITILPGQKVGLVGYSGGGKSTFINLILRLYNIHNGKILIDDQDITMVSQDSLRQAIGMIPQDPSLFHRSLMDNIRYGLSNASDEEVIAAAKKAHAHEFIASLPDGYNSLVGERGVKLSGGQRQRIAIARAILKNAPILILDEATSQLDSVTESYIQESLWQLMQGKTTLVIAHRLSTLLHMDRILVFDQGKIIEDGTHASLLEQTGLYKTLWDAQVGGFLADKQSNI